MSLGLTTDLHPKNHAARSKVLALLAITLLILLPSCRDATNSNKSASPDTPASSLLQAPSLDPAKVTLQPYAENERILTSLPAGPGIIHYFGENEAPTEIPSFITEKFQEADKITQLGARHNLYFDREDMQATDTRGLVVYHHSSSTLYIYGNVPFTETIGQVYHNYLYNSPSYAHIRATIYKVPRRQEIPLIWATPEPALSEIIQSIDLTSYNGSKADITWGPESDISYISTEPSYHREYPWVIDTQLDFRLAEYDCSLSTGVNLTLNQDTTLEIKRSTGYHLLLTLSPAIRLTDGFTLENKYRPDSSENYLAIKPESNTKLTLKSYWVDPEFLQVLAPSEPFEGDSDDPFADPPEPKNPLSSMTGVAGFAKSSRRIKPPQLGNYFSADDVVYDAAEFFSTYGITCKEGCYFIYNHSKQHLHIYGDQILHDLFESIIVNIRHDPPSQYISNILITRQDTAHNTHAETLLGGTIPHLSGTILTLTDGAVDLSIESTFHYAGQSMEVRELKLQLKGLDLQHTSSFIYPLGLDHKQLIHQRGNIQYHLHIKTQRIYADMSSTFQYIVEELTPTREVTQADMIPVEDPHAHERIDDHSSLSSHSPFPDTAPYPDEDSTLFTHSLKAPEDLLNLLYGAYSSAAEDPFAITEEEPNAILLPRQFRLVESPDIAGITSSSDLCYDVKEAIATTGVVLSDESWCIFNATRSTLVTHSTAINHDLLEALLRWSCRHTYPMIKFTVIHISTPNNVESDPYQTSPQDLSKLPDAVIHGSVTSISRSGEKSTISHPTIDPDALPKFSLEAEPSLSEDGRHIDLRYAIIAPSALADSGIILADGMPLITQIPSKPGSQRKHYFILRADIIKL
ncbi:hypothetical protein SAMN02745181_2146 [Rubritalea squalenifaciens DSM 18772]|uniref:Uncharacterized protein n=1 Tax=Rubritalea squalenifaciens DSM 18772 TaxID=1123071 RepID=A0A1M6KM64_9BACT|nr:hypothetical protein [Rubritalea squalenifaciens]SHJ59996.1 hypothetical protein SAMN02745181_2146 [Rubritalea squalenifaciens DSM 18772]